MFIAGWFFQWKVSPFSLPPRKRYQNPPKLFWFGNVRWRTPTHFQYDFSSWWILNLGTCFGFWRFPNVPKRKLKFPGSLLLYPLNTTHPMNQITVMFGWRYGYDSKLRYAKDHRLNMFNYSNQPILGSFIFTQQNCLPAEKGEVISPHFTTSYLSNFHRDPTTKRKCFPLDAGFWSDESFPNDLIIRV